ncbi:MAG: polysaccharide biosynthesis protein [Clostridia bacterium]|nr:polysaccharide biosynthesis protein [Clostridia bacterium]
MSKKSILKGTMIIAVAGLFARFIGLFFRIPLTALIGDEGIGIYSFPMALFVPLSAIVIQGPPTVIAKIVSEKDALSKKEDISLIYHASKKLMIKIGFSVFVLMLLSAPILGKYVWSESVMFPYLALSLAPILLAYSSIYTGLYQGLQDMRAIAYQQLADGIGRLFFGLLIAKLFIRYGVVQGATGAVLGTVIGALAGYIVILLFHKLRGKSILKVEHSKDALKSLEIKIFKSALPITIGAIGASLIPLVDALLLQNRLSIAGFEQNEIYSLNGIVSNVNALINVPMIIGVAISLNVIPNIAAAKVIDIKRLQNRMRSAMILAISLALPSGIGLFLVGKSIFSVFYPSMSINHWLIEIFSISIIFSMINQSFIGILQGADHERLPVKNFYIGLIVKFVFSYILLGIHRINIHGAAISTLIAYVVILFLNYRSCKDLLKFKLDLKYMIFYPLLNTTLMGIVVVGMIYLGHLLNHITLFSLLAIVIGAGVYGILLLTTKVVHIKDIPILNKWVKHESN